MRLIHSRTWLTRRSRGDADAGVSLIEVLVVVIMLGIVGGILTTTMISGMRTTRQEQNRSDSSSLVQTQLARLARDLRVADPIRAASATSMTVDVYRSGTCVRDTWTVASNNLVLTAVTYPTWASCKNYPTTAIATSSITKTIITGLDNGTTPVFAFQDATGATLSSPSPTAIYVVNISLSQAGQEGRAGVSYSTSVGVRNATLA
jgi:type II secretory pathway pseudopilin PulG